MRQEKKHSPLLSPRAPLHKNSCAYFVDNLASLALQSLGVRSWFVEWRAHFGTTAKAQPLTAPVWFGADKHFPPFTWQGWIGSTDKVPGTRSSVSCARDKTRSQNTLAQEKRLLWCVPVGRASWLACAYELGYKLHWFRKEKVHTHLHLCQWGEEVSARRDIKLRHTASEREELLQRHKRGDLSTT